MLKIPDPASATEIRNENAQNFNAATKYIATHRPESLEWGPFEGGKGNRFFAEGIPPRAVELASTNALSSGIVINAYRAAGPLKNQP